jgi:hypothetical protein
MGHGNTGRFLVGVPAQRVPACVRLASGSFSFPAVSALGRNPPTHLSADASSSADDHDALANGPVRCRADAQTVTRLSVSELMLLALADASRRRFASFLVPARPQRYCSCQSQKHMDNDHQDDGHARRWS